MGRDVREIEESALPLCGRKKKLNSSLWLNYFGRERLGLPEAIITDTVQALSGGRERWGELIEHSFLSQEAREMYVELVNSRLERLGV
jgi:serine/threonine-protein kinase HipA